MNPDRQNDSAAENIRQQVRKSTAAGYMAIHPHRLIIDNDPSMFLKLASPEDSEQLYRLVHSNREHLGKYQLWAREIDFEGLDQAVLATVKEIEADRWLQYRIMIPNRDGGHRMIGTVTLFGRELLGNTAKLSFWLAKDEQGNGYARRAVQRLLAYAADSWRLKQVEVDVELDNAHGENLVRKIGATPTEFTTTQEDGDATIIRRKWVIQL